MSMILTILIKIQTETPPQGRKMPFWRENPHLGDLPPLPPREFRGNGNGMGIHGEWQTRYDFLTIRKCYSPNGTGNEERW